MQSQPQQRPVSNWAAHVGARLSGFHQSQDSRPVLLQDPYFHTAAQLEFFDEFMRNYKKVVHERRQELRLKGKAVPTHEDHYHGLKSPHKTLFFRLVSRAQKQIKQDQRVLKQVGGLHFDPSKPVILFTNSVELSEDLQNDPRTIRNLINRMVSAEVILKKVYHGRNADYELHLNPDFLVILDRKNEGFLATTSAAGVTKKWGLHAPQGKKLPLPHTERTERTFNNTIKSKRTDELIEDSGSGVSDSGSSACSTGENIEQNTQSEANPIETRREKICPHPALRSPEVRKEHQTGGRLHPLEREIRQLTLYFLWYAHVRLWNDRKIFEEEYHKTFEYLVGRYFVNCKTMKGVRDRITQMEKVVDHQAEWMAKDPDRFTFFPRKFFDLDRKPGVNDYSGFKGVWRKIYENQRDGKVRADQKASWNAKRRYLSEVERWMLNPTDQGYIKLNRMVQDKWPELMAEFYSTVAEFKKSNQSIN